VDSVTERRRELELSLRASEVPIDRLPAEPEPVRNGTGALTTGDQQDDLLLDRGQLWNRQRVLLSGQALNLEHAADAALTPHPSRVEFDGWSSVFSGGCRCSTTAAT